MNTPIKIHLSLLAALYLTSFSSSVSAGILENYNFETGDLSQVGSTEVEYTTADVSVSTNFARNGVYSMRSDLAHGNKRAEIVSSLRGTVGGENWYAWSVYIPADYPGDGLYDIFTQFHDWHRTLPVWAQDGRAPTNFTMDDGDITFSLKYQSAPETPAHDLFNIGAYTLGAWHDFVMHVKWTHEPHGFVELWLNGVQKVDYTGPTYMDYGAGNGPYFKMGNYKGTTSWSGTSPRIFYMDDYRMGDAFSSYEEIVGALDTNSVDAAFDQTEVTSYMGNQDAGTALVSGDTDITISGNVWKKHPFAVSVTPYSILRFTVDASDSGQILGIGLDDNDDAEDHLRLIQLAGTQTWNSAFQLAPSEQYVAGTGALLYELNLGDLYTGDMTFLTLAGDDDIDASTNATFSNVELYVPIHMNEGSVSSYNDSRDSGTASVTDNLAITISGNVWKKHPLPYIVTSDTVIRFTLEASDAGQILGIGLDDNDSPSDGLRVIQLGGTQTWTGAVQIPVAEQYVAGSGAVEYEIAIGSYFTANTSYLVFVGDDDLDDSTNATFSNIRLFE